MNHLRAPCGTWSLMNLRQRKPVQAMLKMAAQREFISRGRNSRLGLLSSGCTKKWYRVISSPEISIRYSKHNRMTCLALLKLTCRISCSWILTISDLLSLSMNSQSDSHSRDSTMHSARSPGRISRGSRLIIFTQAAALRMGVPGAMMNSRLMQGVMAFQWTWNPKKKKVNPQMQVSRAKEGLLGLRKKVMTIGARQTRIITSVVVAVTSGSTRRVFTPVELGCTSRKPEAIFILNPAKQSSLSSEQQMAQKLGAQYS